MPWSQPNHRPPQIGPARREPDPHGARKLRSSRRYGVFRDWLAAHKPLCADPFGQHLQDHQVVAGVELHHIEPVARRPDLLTRADNCVMLCTWCHSRISRLERAGQDCTGYFRHDKRGRTQDG